MILFSLGVGRNVSWIKVITPNYLLYRQVSVVITLTPMGQFGNVFPLHVGLSLAYVKTARKRAVVLIACEAFVSLCAMSWLAKAPRCQCQSVR